MRFQSAHSIQSAMRRIMIDINAKLVSIRALHTECDYQDARSFSSLRSFNPRTPYRVRSTSSVPSSSVMGFQSAHSIQSAMATQSKIRLIRALTTPLSQQNRRILGDPFPRPHPCARPRRENTCRFYDHLGFALEPSFGISHSFVSRLQNFGRPRQTTFLGLPCHPTKRRVRP